MRKYSVWILLLAWVLSLSTTAYAAETGLSVSDGYGQPGDTVYLAVMLDSTVTGDSMGISYTYDDAVLEAVPAASTWNVQGVLQDFDDKNQGVWASDAARALNGTVCVLAFRIRPEAKLTQTTVSCTVVIRNGSAEVGSYTAQAAVSGGCNHQFGAWSDIGAVGHSRECSLCQSKQTQSHSWNAGAVRENPDNPQTDWMVFTCTVCGAEKRLEIPKGNTEDTPEVTQPSQTVPSLPTAPDKPEQEAPTRPNNTRPTKPDNGEDTSRQDPENSDNQAEGSGNHVHDYNEAPPATDPHDHDPGSAGEPHGEEDTQTLPLSFSSNTECTDPAHDHSHDHEAAEPVSKETQNRNLLLVFAMLAVMAGGLWYYLKKK